MGSDHAIAAVTAALPVIGSEPVASLRESAIALLPAPMTKPDTAPVELTELSVTGKLLSALLQASPSAGVVATAALLPAPDRQTRTIADAVRRGIEYSGLFYESHLVDWHVGRRELAALKQEPQAHTTDAEALSAILRQQLELLDSQPLQWQGELWPGLPVQLQLNRHTPDQRGKDAEDLPSAWSTTLVSTLPVLGSVVATLRIEGDRLQLRLQASDSASALLAEQATELRESLTSVGLQLQSFEAASGSQA